MKHEDLRIIISAVIKEKRETPLSLQMLTVGRRDLSYGDVFSASKKLIFNFNVKNKISSIKNI